MWSGQCKLHQRREHQALLATLPILEHCICGQHLTVKRALICTCGGFPSICHNELRDMHGWDPHWSVSQCRNWATTSTTHRWTPYTWISKQGGWGPSRHCSWQVLGKRPEPCHFWHISVFSPFAQSHQNTFLSQCYKKNKRLQINGASFLCSLWFVDAPLIRWKQGPVFTHSSKTLEADLVGHLGSSNHRPPDPNKIRCTVAIKSGSVRLTCMTVLYVN